MRKTLILTIFFAVITSNNFAQEHSPKVFSADVPESILTPDKVESKYLGELNFFDGLPDEKTVQKTYDFLDVARGTEAFLNGIPAASIYAMLEGLKEAGVQTGGVGIFETLMDARTLFLTANSSTPYIFGEIDVKNGPVVVNVSQPVLGMVDDAYFRHVTDIGVTGPDKGAGGKYLFVGPDFTDDIPEGYIVVKTKTYRHWLFLRLVTKPGEAEKAIELFKQTFNCYALADENNKPQQQFVNLSGKQFNTIHANDIHFYDELNAVVQYEPADAFNPELVGTFASIGIKKGEEFNPDERMKGILQEAITIGNSSARAISFRPRSKSWYFYSDRQWYSPFSGGSHTFTNNGERVLDDRIIFHYMATGITPAMAQPKPGTGSAYGFTSHDSQANYLDGGRIYSVTLPSPIPAKNFWSFMVYSTQHRSMLETSQKFAGLDNMNPDVKPDKDGSYTLWFGPEAPEGKEGNWVQTIPGKGYCVLLRLYGPIEPWFDKTWKPGDFILKE